MGREERVLLIGPSSTTYFQRMALEGQGHWVLNENLARKNQLAGLETAAEQGMTVAVVYGDGKEGQNAEEEVAVIKQMAPDVQVVLYSFRTPQEAPHGAILFKREGTTDDFFRLANFVTRLEKPQR